MHAAQALSTIKVIPMDDTQIKTGKTSRLYPIPERIAFKLAQKYKKEVIIILAVDSTFTKVHTTTFSSSVKGKTFIDKFRNLFKVNGTSIEVDPQLFASAVKSASDKAVAALQFEVSRLQHSLQVANSGKINKKLLVDIVESEDGDNSLASMWNDKSISMQTTAMNRLIVHELPEMPDMTTLYTTFMRSSQIWDKPSAKLGIRAILELVFGRRLDGRLC